MGYMRFLNARLFLLVAAVFFIAASTAVQGSTAALSSLDGARSAEHSTDKQLSSGLAAYWKFDEGTGNQVFDSSPYGNNGFTYFNPAWITGKSGSALYCDGSNGYVRVDDSASLDIGTSDFTVMAWVKPDQQLPGTGAIVSKIISYNPGYFIGVLADYRATFVLLPAPGGTYDIISSSSTSAISPGSWHHVAVTFRRQDNAVFYLDGIKYDIVPINDFSGDISNNRDLFIGRSEGSSSKFKGGIDEA